MGLLSVVFSSWKNMVMIGLGALVILGSLYIISLKYEIVSKEKKIVKQVKDISDRNTAIDKLENSNAEILKVNKEVIDTIAKIEEDYKNKEKIYNEKLKICKTSTNGYQNLITSLKGKLAEKNKPPSTITKIVKIDTCEVKIEEVDETNTNKDILNILNESGKIP